MPTPTLTRLAAILSIATLALLAGCGDDDNGDTATTASPTTPVSAAPDDASATAATMAPTTDTGAPDGASATAVSPPSPVPAGTPYSTTQFVQPLDLVVPSWLIATPSEDTAHFVTFASPDESLAIRILLPVLVYPPGETGTTPPPDDYVSYLLGQADFGAQLTDRVDTTVDGHPATIVTAATSTPIDGSLGCPEEGIEADSCYGIQPDRIIRLAVITTDAGAMLIWLRTNTEDHPNMADVSQLFDALLADVRFADRQPEADPAETAGPLDGTYTWTITDDDVLAHGPPEHQTPEGLAFYPNTFAVTIDHGVWDMHETSTTDTGHGTVEAAADHAEFHWDLDTFTFDIARDADGTLHLTPVDGLKPDDIFIWTTEPWTPAGSALDGTFTWTLTAEDAPVDPNYDPNQLSTYPWTFSMSLSTDGTCSMYHIENTERYEDGACTYEANGDRVDFRWPGMHIALSYTADPDGSLHMTGIPPIDPGDNYVFTTKAWIPQ